MSRKDEQMSEIIAEGQEKRGKALKGFGRFALIVGLTYAGTRWAFSLIYTMEPENIYLTLYLAAWVAVGTGIAAFIVGPFINWLTKE